MAKYPATREIWTTSFGKEWRNLAQGDHKIGTKGTNSLFVLDHRKIKRIPADRTVTYANILVDYCPQKAHSNRVRITTGVNLIKYPGELTTIIADITTS